MTGDPLAGATVAVLGGTGALGLGLARRFARAGLPVVLGSRDGARAVRAAEGLAAATGGDVRGATNRVAARSGDPVVVAVPWQAHAAVLASVREELAGSVVVDCVNPLGFDEHGAYALDVPEGSATQQAAALLPGARVTGAFHHVAAAVLSDPAATRVDCDVMVVGDDEAACDLTVALVERVPGLRGLRAGRLRDARQVEALTANVISVNRRLRVHAGLRLTGF